MNSRIGGKKGGIRAWVQKSLLLREEMGGGFLKANTYKTKKEVARA